MESGFFRRAVQLASLGLFIWLLSRALWPLAEWPVDIFLRSDPLLALAVPLAAREFVAYDDRILSDVPGHALVDVGLMGRFVRRHADAVAHHAGEYLVFLYLRQLELLQPEVVLPVQSS